MTQFELDLASHKVACKANLGMFCRDTGVIVDFDNI